MRVGSDAPRYRRSAAGRMLIPSTLIPALLMSVAYLAMSLRISGPSSEAGASMGS
jgi:hypothetical protein